MSDDICTHGLIMQFVLGKSLLPIFGIAFILRLRKKKKNLICEHLDKKDGLF